MLAENVANWLAHPNSKVPCETTKLLLESAFGVEAVHSALSKVLTVPEPPQ